MMMKRLALLACLLLVAAPAAAQEEIGVAKIYLNGSPTLTSGSGTPESVVTATPGSLFLRTDTGSLYIKATGTGNTGWVVSSLTGSGTANTVTKWTGTSTLGNSTTTDDGTTLTLAPGGDIVVNPTGNDVLPTTGYDINLGALTTKFLTLHAAELWVETLVAQSTMATIGGRILVAPTTLLTSDLSTGATSIVVKHNNLANGDRVYLEANGAVEFLAVTSSASGSGPYTYSVTRNLDGSGANAWAAGDAVLNTGTTGNGFIDLYSVRGVKAGTEIGPTIVFNQRLSSTYNDWSPRAAIGNLDGLFGYSGSTYGAAFGVPTGPRTTIDATNGVRLFAASSATSTRVTLDATNGLRIFGSDNDEKVTIDLSGNATFDGLLTVGTGRNQVRNSECRVSTDDWAVFISHAQATSLSFNLASFRLNEESNTCFVTAAGTPAGATVTNLYNTVYMPVTVGLRYEASAYIGLHRATSAVIGIIWYDSAGSILSVSTGNTCTTASAGGTTLAGYCRGLVLATAPSSATTARIQVSMTHNGTQADPYLFVVRSYFAEAGAAQEDATQWGPAGVTEIIGGLIKTDAIDARTIAANAITTSELAADSVTSSKIVAGTIVASDIASATITATQIASATITGTQIAASTITASNLSVSTLSAITANMGTITAGSITGGTIDGATIRAGSGDEVTLDSSGITMAAGTGANNKIKWSDGVTVSAPNSGSVLYVDGNLTVERQINVTGTGAGAAAITVSGGFGIAADTLISPSMASSTGTTVIWENACGCLKKQTSSARYKEDIQPWRASALGLLEATPITFAYRGGSARLLGLSAEDVYRVAPEAVNLDAEGRPDSIDQSGLNAYLLQVIKELSTEVRALRAERSQR